MSLVICSLCNAVCDRSEEYILNITCNQKSCGIHTYHQECIVKILEKSVAPQERQMIFYMKKYKHTNINGIACPDKCGGKVIDSEFINKTKTKRDPPPIINKKTVKKAIPIPQPIKKSLVSKPIESVNNSPTQKTVKNNQYRKPFHDITTLPKMQKAKPKIPQAKPQPIQVLVRKKVEPAKPPSYNVWLVGAPHLEKKNQNQNISTIHNITIKKDENVFTNPANIAPNPWKIHPDTQHVNDNIDDIINMMLGIRPASPMTQQVETMVTQLVGN